MFTILDKKIAKGNIRLIVLLLYSAGEIKS